MTDEQEITSEQVAEVPAALVQYAFRCNNCNTLIEAAAAGERELPAKCPICGKGVKFTEDGIKTYDEANWTVLADLDGPDKAGVFEYHQITDEHIARHTPFEPPADADPNHEPQSIEVHGEGSAAGAVDTTGDQA